MAFKRAKKKQTDYNIGGKAISDTAIPLHQKNLTRMDEYLSDPSARQDMYLDKYYGANNVDQSDFLRNYKRAMAQTTANNYSATSGGYSSSGQRAYDDNQRGWNDYAARLKNQGIASAYSMANQDYANMVGANPSYQNAYSLGKAYSDVDQYNDLAKQANSRWYTGVMNALGDAGLASNNPWGMAIGAALKTGGSLLSTDAGDQLDAMNNSTTAGGNARASSSTSDLASAFTNGWQGVNTLVNDWKSGNKTYFPKWAGGKGIQANKIGG